MTTRSLVIPVFNGFGHLPLLWESLVPQIDNDTEVIFVDDGSSRSLREFLRVNDHPGVSIFSNPYPLGFSSAVNIGLRAAKGGHLFILNSDLILGHDTLARLSSALDKDSSIGMVSSKLLYPQTARVQHVGLAYSETNHFHVFRHAHPNNPLVCRQRETQALAFALCCMPREVYEEVGSLDENYFNSYEDLDYCFRVRRLRKRLVLEPLSIAYHWERQSGPIRSVLRKDNVARLWRNWGREIYVDLPDYISEAIVLFRQIHPDICRQEFTPVNLSKGREAERILLLLSTYENGFSMGTTWEIGARRSDAYHLWLPQLLPVDAIRNPRPFIYLVDEYPQLDENAYWFTLRREFVPDEIVIDHNANLICTSELF